MIKEHCLFFLFKPPLSLSRHTRTYQISLLAIKSSNPFNHTLVWNTWPGYTRGQIPLKNIQDSSSATRNAWPSQAGVPLKHTLENNFGLQN